MKKFLFLFSVAVILNISSYAQVASYIFSTDTTTYTEITGGTLLGSTSTDEESFVDPAVPAGSTTTSGVGLPIGFNFQFNGETFDVIGVNANGWIGFGKSALTPSVNLSTTYMYKPISTASTVTPAILQNKVSAFGKDIGGSLGNNSSLRYIITGSAPNRVLTVQWKGFRRTYLSSGDNLNFQICIYETTNIVEFIYGSMVNNPVSAIFGEVGLRGASNSDFSNRYTDTDWSASFPGSTNSAMVKLSDVVYPVIGLVYRFTPLSVGVENLTSAKPEIYIFPNPANGFINMQVKGNKTADVNCAIYNMQGQLVYSEKIFTDTHNSQFDFSFLTKGIYMVKISDETNNIFEKLIIQ